MAIADGGSDGDGDDGALGVDDDWALGVIEGLGNAAIGDPVADTLEPVDGVAVEEEQLASIVMMHSVMAILRPRIPSLLIGLPNT